MSSRPWLPYYSPGVAHTLEYKQGPLYAYLDRAAAESSDVIACSFHNQRLSYAELLRQAEVVAANLKKHGLEFGDRVGVMLPNLPQTIVVFWGIIKAGGVVVFFNPLHTPKEIINQGEDSEPRFMISIDMCWSKILPTISRLRVEKYFITSLFDSLSFPLNWLQHFKSKRSQGNNPVYYDNKTVFKYSALLAGKERFSAEIPNPRDDLAALQYTSGTTGTPKGIMLTHANFVANVEQCLSFLHLLRNEHQVFLALLPLFHVYGLTTSLLFPAAMASTVIPVPRFVPSEVLSIIQKQKVTIFPGAPSVYISLLQQSNGKKYNISSLTHCISGSAPMPVAQALRFRKQFGAEIIEGYGLSEASPITHLNPTEGRKKSGSIGVPFPDTDAMVVEAESDSFTPVPLGMPGELLVRGPQVMKGYWKRPEESAKALRGGWLHTGDMAVMDTEGYFKIVDRIKDIVISGGYNVYPQEVDHLLMEHPNIKDAICIGVAHKTRGEILKAFVVPMPGKSLSKEEVLHHCRAKLANYKVPRLVEFRDNLPKSSLGKTLRKVMREEEALKMAARGASAYEDVLVSGEQIPAASSMNASGQDIHKNAGNSGV